MGWSNFMKSLLVAVVFDFVVAAKRDESPCSESIGEENLSTSLHPNLIDKKKEKKDHL